MKSVIVFLAVFALTSLTTEARIKNCPQWTTYNDGGSRYSICLSSDNLNYNGGKGFCETKGGALCDLRQLAKMYNLGARDDHWALTMHRYRDARMSPCGDYEFAECYNNDAPQPYFPHTPRPNYWEQVFCCKFP